MSFVTILGVVIAAWALLRLVGSERQREMIDLARRVAAELEQAKQAAANPPTAGTPAPPSVLLPRSPVPVPISPARKPQQRPGR